MSTSLLKKVLITLNSRETSPCSPSLLARPLLTPNMSATNYPSPIVKLSFTTRDQSVRADQEEKRMVIDPDTKAEVEEEV